MSSKKWKVVIVEGEVKVIRQIENGKKRKMTGVVTLVW